MIIFGYGMMIKTMKKYRDINTKWNCWEITDTRHYYTHYGSSKEKKALKGDDLGEAIFVLSSLLEYHICLILGVDIEEKVRRSLKSHNSWKQLEKAQIKEMEEKENRV